MTISLQRNNFLPFALGQKGTGTFPSARAGRARLAAEPAKGQGVFPQGVKLKEQGWKTAGAGPPASKGTSMTNLEMWRDIVVAATPVIAPLSTVLAL